MRYLRPVIILLGLVALWQAVIWATGIERFILPGPAAVADSLFRDAAYLAENALVTAGEILAGLAFGILLGCWTAIGMAASRGLRDWMLPVLIASQAIPVFALAPILVLWFGFGMWPKIVMATLIIYFPVTAAFFDGLRRSEPGWLDLASTMGSSRWRILRHIRIPAALPSLASGIRVATAVAPIGAVVGEWVGASAGLGHVMVQSRAQADEPRMFAALFILAVVAVGLYVAVDHLLRLLLPWQRESNPNED